MSARRTRRLATLVLTVVAAVAVVAGAGSGGRGATARAAANHGGASIKHGLLLDPANDQDGGQPVYADSLRNTLSWQGNYMDSKFGPDGALILQVYDGFFRANPNVGLYRFDYIGGPDTPGPDPQATPAGGRRVAFSIGRSGGVSYRWDFGDGRSSTAENPTITYRSDGTFAVTLTVTYADGEQASETIEVTVP